MCVCAQIASQTVKLDSNKLWSFFDDIINFLLKSLSIITSVESKQICSFDELETHTRSIALVGVEPIISAIQFKDFQSTNQLKLKLINLLMTTSTETPVASHALQIWRETKMKTLKIPVISTPMPLDFWFKKTLCSWNSKKLLVVYVWIFPENTQCSAQTN